MNLTNEIVDILSTENGSLTDALLKTKVLLHSLGQADLVVWINSEFNGYGENQELPHYRKVPAQVLADLTDINFIANAHPIPIGHLSQIQRKNLELIDMRQSLSVLEKYSDDSDGNLQTPIPLEYNNLLGNKLRPGVAIQRSWCQVEISAIIQLLTEVRSRLLDFVLHIKDQTSSDNDLNVQTIDKNHTRDLFNNAIFGDNSIIVIGDRNKTEIRNLYLKGNIDALKHELRKYNVDNQDIEDLEEAIQYDKLDANSMGFGPAVNSWIQNMLQKAREAAWQIELGMASAVLTDALNHYYGLWK